jgi:hypothetical protein
VRAVEDLSGRTLRELLTLARERLGSAASGLKTRDELLAALRGEVVPTPAVSAPDPVVAPREAPVQVVTRDFFRRRT